MKSFKIQITEKFAKTFEIEADSFEDAIITIKQKYKRDEIVINSSDYRDTTFESSDFTVEFQTLISELIEYVQEKETFNDVVDSQKKSDHIFTKIQRLRELNAHW